MPITSQQLQCSYRIMGSSVIGIGLGTQRDYFIFIMSDSHTLAVYSSYNGLQLCHTLTMWTASSQKALSQGQSQRTSVPPPPSSLWTTH